MRKMNLSWVNNSIFKRLILTFVAIIVPLYVLGIGVYQWAVHTVKSEITNSTRSQVDFYLGNLEKDIERIRLLQINFLVDDDLDQLAFVPDSLDDIGKMNAMLRLQKRLLSIKNSSPYIYNAGVHIPSIGKTIYADGVSEFDRERFDRINSYVEKSTSPIMVLAPNKMVIAVKKPALPNQKDDSKVFIEVQMFNKKIIDELMKFINDEDSGLVMMNMEGTFSLSTDPESEIGKHLIAYTLKNSLKNPNPPETLTVKAAGKKYIGVYSLSHSLDIVLYKYLSEDRILKKINKYVVWFWVFTLSSGVMVFLFSFSTYRFIKKPLNKLMRSFKQVEDGNLSIRINHKNNDEFKSLYQSFNTMAANVNQLLEQVYMLKILSQRAELKQLQAQINPHFLYNSFFILYNMVDYDSNENVKKFAKQLGNYFQFITRSAEDDVPLSKEVDHARTYAEIQAKRFRNRLTLYFEPLPEAFENAVVPRLILQPFIENAFEHGMENKMEDGIVKITFHGSGNVLTICIEDNGDPMTDEVLNKIRNNLCASKEEMESTGILNIHRRLQLKFGADSGVTVSRGELGGLKVSIHMNLMEDSLHV